jgi:hypothetical protein
MQIAVWKAASTDVRLNGSTVAVRLKLYTDTDFKARMSPAATIPCISHWTIEFTPAGASGMVKAPILLYELIGIIY